MKSPLIELGNRDKMIDWIAIYVTEINSLEVPKGTMIELIVMNGNDESMIVRRSGKTLEEAFRKCVRYGMRNFHPIK